MPTTRSPPLCALDVVLVCVVVSVRLTGRPEVLDVAEVGLAVRLVDPDGLDPHAEPHLVGVALLDQEHRRDVGAVEPDPRADVRRLEPGARDPGDAEGADGALAGERALLVGRYPAHRARAARRHGGLLATGAALADDLALLHRAQEPRRRHPRRVGEVEVDRRLDDRHVTGRLAHSATSVSAPASGRTKHARSRIDPTRWSAQRALTRMPVRIAPGSATSTAASRPVSAPSSWTSAHANGRSSGWPRRGVSFHAQVVTTPSSATGTISDRSSLGTGSYSAGGTRTRPSAARTPTICRSRSAVMKAPMTGPVDRVYVYSMVWSATSTSGAPLMRRPLLARSAPASP